ncbi:MAG: hypothetical protein PHY72_04105 [Candidatus Pacebacteria bacterium]|nr:hypothetical protein [Candidatus Paceibacterota bacterium]
MDERRKIIVEELEMAKRGKHFCADTDCLINVSVPILSYIEAKEQMDLLVDLIYFCYSQRELLSEERFEISKKGELVLDETYAEGFQQMLKEVEEFSNVNLHLDEEVEQWLKLAKEAGKDKESIVALVELYLYIQAIFGAWKIVVNKKITMNAIYN